MTNRLAARYRRFADTEAHGHSPLYEALANGIAGDAEVLAFVSTLPPDKQQPNLLLAAVRHIAGTPSGWPEFRGALLAQTDIVRAVVLPVLARLRGPLACACYRIDTPTIMADSGRARACRCSNVEQTWPPRFPPLCPRSCGGQVSI